MAVPLTVCVRVNWRDNATKYLFLDDIFQPSPMLFGVGVADDLLQSSPAIVDGLIDAFCDLVSIN